MVKTLNNLISECHEEEEVTQNEIMNKKMEISKLERKIQYLEVHKKEVIQTREFYEKYTKRNEYDA